MSAQTSAALSRATGALAKTAKSVVVGTGGHIDHGKTALVYALTGTDTDRLPEEKQRGITIDLGFAAMDLESPGGDPLHLSLIDVPGHHAFIRNMLAGAGGIDCLLLVIAADEGVKAQTTEHLAICALLGIERGLVALTKADMVSEDDLARQREAVRSFLKGTFLESEPLIAVSARTGSGLAELKVALARVAASVPERGGEFVPRLPLDRSFSMRGFGTVVTGTLQVGSIRVGETLEQHPAGRSVRVRGLQVHNKSREHAQAPCRVALNLAGVEVAEIGRGDTLAPARMLAPSAVVDVELNLLRGTPALKHGARVQVHAFTADTAARVLLFDQKESREPGSGLARLRLDRPMLLFPGDRLVLRQCSPVLTIGGARVLDAAVPAGVRKRTALAWLKAVQRADDGEALRLRAARRGAEGVTLQALVRETGLLAPAVRARIAPLAASGWLLECSGHGSHWIAAEALQRAVERVEQELGKTGGLSRAELRSKTGLNAPVFELVLQRLLAGGRFELAGETVRKRGTGEQIPERERKLLNAIEATYAKAALAAPLLSEVTGRLGVTEKEMRSFVTVLLRSRRLVRMGDDDAFVHSSALERLYGELRKHRGESFDVARFKAFTGLTRKHAIPLLEHLDQARVTRNCNGIRIVL